MGLILTRSPFFVSSEGYGTNVQVGLSIDYLLDGVVTNVSYQLEFGTQKEIDVSPLIADYYSKEADVLHVEIEVDGSDNLTVFDYLATDGYGYYEDGYNLDLDNIENKSDQELKEIVSYQKESFIKNTWNKERTKEYFKCLLEEKS